MEHAIQIIYLLFIFFIYTLSGSVVYSYVGEGYKATPLRCFAVGAGIWVLLALLSTVIYPVGLNKVWWLYVVITLIGLLRLPKKDQIETLSPIFFAQIALSFILLLPTLMLLGNDKLHLWQEFAVYAQSFKTLVLNNQLSAEVLKYPVAYQLTLFPISIFTDVKDSIFACFNFTLVAFVVCEFVRNCGVRLRMGNLAFPLIITLGLIIVLNPFSIKQLSLSADPFIFTSAIAFAFSEYIFRKGYLPKNIAAIPAGFILLLLSFSSMAGLLLAFSLLLTLIIRYVLQASTLNHKQYTGFLIIPLIPICGIIIFKMYLQANSLDMLFIDFSAIDMVSIKEIYKGLYVLASKHVVATYYIIGLLLLSLYTFKNIKKTEDIILDNHLFRPVLWISFIYLFICLPIFFSQYSSVSYASYSLGFSSIALLQFIIFMPIGRLVYSKLETSDISISPTLKYIIIACIIAVFISNKDTLYKKQNDKIENILNVSKYINKNIEKNSKIAFVDIKKTSKFYVDILTYDNADNQYLPVNVLTLPKGFANTHKYFKNQGFDYIILHAPNNLTNKSFELYFDPNYTYIYKIEDDSFVLYNKIDNLFYYDSNFII